MTAAKLLAIACAAALTAISGTASAAPITFQFGGTVTASPVAGINVGDAISGQFTFDSGTSATFPVSPNAATYANTISSYSVQIGGFSASALTGNIIVINNLGGSFDGYVVGAGLLTSTPVPGLTASQSFFEAHDASGAALSSTVLPLTPPDLSDFITRTYYVLRFLDANNVRYQVDGTLTSLVEVPAPAALTLALLGLLGIAGFRKAARAN